jgi:di/tricarboxylate transporter
MDITIVFLTLGVALALFAWGKIRHDIVAVICLLILVGVGIIPSENAFLGFAHPAVITVAMILIVSKGLQNSGLIDVIGQRIMKLGNNITLQIGVLCTVVCIASAFMNNVGALAILMPITINIAKKSNRSPSLLLMPVAFASLLGGMITLIGTPPNIIISSYRAEATGEAFGMFAFAPVGIAVSFIGLIFIILVGWRMLPKRISSSNENDKFNIEDYITEVVLKKDSKINENSLGTLYENTESDINVLNIIRDNHLIHAPDLSLILRENDILTIEADAEELKKFIEETKVKLVGKGEIIDDAVGSENISNVEAVIMNDASILNRTASGLRMRSRYGVNLLAISRQNTRIRKRIDHVKFKVGDVLLLQGDASKMNDTLSSMGCLPLADRGFTIDAGQKILMALYIFLTAIFLVISGLVDVQIAFTGAALLMVLSGVIKVREIYTSVDWPVIVLLGALLPVGAAMETTGGTEIISNLLISLSKEIPGWGTISIIMMISMLLSGVINNAATVVLMAPLGITLASSLGLSVDAILMAIAIGSSSAFLTPIGHQSNTLVMGPGGYKFTDYTLMGLPLSIIIIIVSIPLLLHFFPV